MLTYEDRLNRDFSWALEQGSLYFERRSDVQIELVRFAQRLDALGVPYAVIGALAMFFHGYRRFTEDIDILVTKDGLRRIHGELVGDGYAEAFTGSKALRHVETGVRIDFCVTGQFPGDRTPKPVAFPDPQGASIDINGIRIITLVKLIELKLTYGISNPGRLRHIADVQEMVKVLRLALSFSEQLHPHVQAKYGEIWVDGEEEPAEWS